MLTILTEVVRSAVIVLKDRKGVTALEYGVLAAGIIAVIAAVIFAIGTNLNKMFGSVSTAL